MTKRERAVELVMLRLGRAADHGVLWIAIAVGLGASRGKWRRRAALRGLAGVTISGAAGAAFSGVAGAAFRGAAFSGAAGAVGVPSRHAASAAAFATGVAIEVPALAIPVGALAAAVGASRLVGGAHRPSGVAAGFALGTAAGLVTLRWWPRRPAVPASAARPRSEAPASLDGAGLVMVVNRSAGTASDDLAASLGKALPAAEIVVASADDDLSLLFTDAAGRAAILGVAGGDGTVRLAAATASDSGLPLLVIPAGTFNHFAADLGVHSAGDALAALRDGDSVCVDVAVADGDTFLNTASAGVYVDLVHAREQLEPRFGKWPAMVIALVRVLHGGRPVELLVDGRRRVVWLLFAGNCCYEPSGAAPGYRPDLADGVLDVRLVDGSQPLARTRLVAAVLLGTLGRCRVYLTWRASALSVASTNGGPVPLCLDGEATRAGAAISLVKHPKQLLVYRPATGA
jgi:undecaprenyl-diphosphatase